MDWILKQAIEGGGGGLEWLGGNEIAGLDFTDDIALLEENWSGMQELTSRIEEEARKVGLCINTGKTKLMKIGIYEEEADN